MKPVAPMTGSTGARGAVDAPPSTQPAGIEFRAVSKRYGRGADAALAVDAISFTVPSGTLTTILGPSGSGKTTTLRMIAGLEAPSAGQVLIAGVDVTHAPATERDVSMVFQSYALFPHLDVLGNVAYGLDVSRVPKPEAQHRARRALGLVGLTGLDKRLPSELSGGQQQRVALARALVLEPAVLLFDEPLSNLDARLRRTMREEIRMLQRRLSLTVAYVTHDQAEAMAVSDQIIVMDHGRIAQAGTPIELYEHPCSEFVAEFMGEAMLFDGTGLDDGRVRIGPISVRIAEPVPAGPLRVAVRPSAWQVLPLGIGELPATVAKSAYLGQHCETTFDTALGPIFVSSAASTDLLKVGDDASLRLAGHGIAVLPR
jgi:iron(III) transport system ATP-binding protein